MIREDIEVFGGVVEVAEILGLTKSRVVQFFYPRSKGGCDGCLPYKHAKKLLIESEKRGYTYTLEYLMGEE